MEEDDTLFKITCQSCNVFVKCKGKSGELLYINFIHAIFSTLVLYPKSLILKFLISVACQKQNVTHLPEYFLKNIMGITSFKGFHIFKTTTLRFYFQQSHWIRLTLSMQELFKLNLPEIIQVLLPTQKQSILLVNGYITVSIK